MANLEKIVDELSSLTVLEAAELAKLLESKWGVSAAAAVAASVRVAQQEAKAGREAVIVTILSDSSEKYMSEHFWQEQD